MKKTTRSFVNLTDRLLRAPRDVVQKRIEQHREQAENNPRKRGPKPKAKTASGSDREEA